MLPKQVPDNNNNKRRQVRWRENIADVFAAVDNGCRPIGRFLPSPVNVSCNGRASHDF